MAKNNRLGNQLKTSLIKVCDAIEKFETTPPPKDNRDQKRKKLLKSIEKKLEDF